MRNYDNGNTPYLHHTKDGHQTLTNILLDINSQLRRIATRMDAAEARAVVYDERVAANVPMTTLMRIDTPTRCCCCCSVPAPAPAPATAAVAAAALSAPALVGPVAEEEEEGKGALLKAAASAFKARSLA